MKNIFIENIDYSKTNNLSIWGKGDPKTIKILNAADISGKWLNLAAGDGRYNLNLLKKASFVVASDIDKNALDKLKQNTPKKYLPKIKLETFNLTRRFPFNNNSFDGVFCAGTLHLFPKGILKEVFDEIDRILKPKGKIIIDFATDIKRVLSDSKLYIRKGEPQYTLKSATNILSTITKNFNVVFYKDEILEEKIHAPQGFHYNFSCSFLVVVGEKKS